jgi:hypothetical protein
MDTSVTKVSEYLSFAQDASYHAFEIQAQAKAVWALLERVQENHPGIEGDLTPVSYLLSSIERSSEQLAVSISNTEFTYRTKQRDEVPT